MDLEPFCDAWLAAWTGGSPERLLAFYADDAEYADPARPQGLKGRDALAAYFGKLLPPNPDMVWTRRELHRIGPDAFVVTWTARIPVRGQVVVENGCDLVWLRGGKIARNEVYFDRSAWLKALRAEA